MIYFLVLFLFFAHYGFSEGNNKEPNKDADQESADTTVVFSEEPLKSVEPMRFEFNDPIPYDPTWGSCSDLINVNIVGIVGDKIITSADLTARAMLLTDGRYHSLSDDAQVAVKHSALEALIDEKVIILLAGKSGTTISEKEIKQIVKQMESDPDYGPNHFANVATAYNINIDHIYDMLRGDILWRSLASKEISDIKNRQAVQVQETESPQIFLEEIAVSQIGTPEDFARSIKQALTEGVTFSNLAGRISALPSAIQNGIVGWIPVSLLPDNILDHIKDLPAGSTTDVIRTHSHYCIYRVAGRRTATEALQNKWSYSFAQLSLTLSPNVKERYQQIQNLNVLKASCKNIKDLEQMSTQIESAQFAVHNKSSLENLNDTFQMVLRNLNDGFISNVVIDGNQAHVFFLIEKTESGLHNNDRYILDASTVLRQKKASIREQIYTATVESF